jgi:hypothetical protein
MCMGMYQDIGMVTQNCFLMSRGLFLFYLGTYIGTGIMAHVFILHEPVRLIVHNFTKT